MWRKNSSRRSSPRCTVFPSGSYRSRWLAPACRNYVDSYRRVIGMEKDAYDDPDLQAPPEELIDAILAIRREP